MITDMFGKEIKYLDYIEYIRKGKEFPQLAKVIRIVIAKQTRIVVASVFDINLKYVDNRALKALNNIEVVSEDWAKENYSEDYERLKNCR